MIALRLTLLAPAAFAAPAAELMPTLSSSLDTGSPMPITSLPQLSPSARLSLRRSPDTRILPALTSSTSSPPSTPSTARGRLRLIPSPLSVPPTSSRRHQGDHQALRARSPHRRGPHHRRDQLCPQERVRGCHR